LAILRGETRALETVAGFRSRAMNVEGGGSTERWDGIEATGDFFDAIGVRPELGRFFTRADEVAGGGRLVVISDGLWRQRFGTQRDVIGRVITLNAEPYVIVGVAPPGFAFPRGAEMPATFQFPPRAEAWVPIEPPRGGPEDLAIVGRLRGDATPEALRADLRGASEEMEKIYPQAKGYFDTIAIPLRTQLIGQSKRLLLSLLGAVLLLLLISVVNAAQLQLAQLDRRRRDLAVRAALGAPRWRMLLGSTVEVTVISVVAGALGTGLALAGFRILQLRLGDVFPLIASGSFEPLTAVVSVVVTLVVGLIAGLGPALFGARIPLIETLRRGSRGGGGRAGSARARRFLIIAELALAVVLVAIAGLMAKSLSRQLNAEIGFSASNGLTFEVTLPTSRYPERQGPTFMEHPAGAPFIATALERIRAIPGVQAAAMGKPLPLSGSQEWTVFTAEGREQRENERLIGADYTVASEDMFRALGTPILAGRDFGSSDREDGLPVVIVNRAMAKWLWPGEKAVGKRIHLGGPRSVAPWMTVVGVAADLRRYALTDTTRPEMTVNYTQKPYPSFGTLQFVVRSNLSAGSLASAIQRTIAQIDPAIPISHVRTMPDLIADASASARFGARFMTAFAATALLLSMVGLYGVIAYSVLQRRQEFGVRRALGAANRHIVGVVAGEAAALAAVGVPIGLAIAVGAGLAIRRLLYGVAAYDVTSLAASVTVIWLATIAACVVPTVRALKVEPRTALDEA
jgi:predicted permease